MNENPYPQRKSSRLQGYDYSQSGAYFVTICTHKRIHWFSHIVDDTVQLHPIGQIVAECWAEIPTHFVGVELDLRVIMPNHIHSIIILAGGGAALGTIVGNFKAAVTRQARRQHRMARNTLWHTRYYDRVIRDELALERIREYIMYNPAQWQSDTFYAS